MIEVVGSGGLAWASYTAYDVGSKMSISALSVNRILLLVLICSTTVVGLSKHNVTSCGPGEHVENSTGACVPCPIGQFQDSKIVTTSITCKECAPGLYAPDPFDLARPCENCPRGYYQPGSALPYCLPCSKGDYQDLEGQISCKDCPKHKYSNRLNNTGCKTCEIGKFTVTKGSRECIACSPGTYGKSFGGDCTSCPVGFFRPVNSLNTTACTRCPAGFTSIAVGSFGCTFCGKGQYGLSPGVCETCDPGRYQDNRGETNCKVCGQDTYSTKKGAASIEDCRSCHASRTTGGLTSREHESACVCRKSDYFTNDKNECEKCPAGADCGFLNDGISVERLVPQNGYWRPHENSTTFVNCASIRSEDASRRCCPVNSSYKPQIEMNKTACACQAKFPYLGGMYEGCAETPDWPGNTWCYIVGPNEYCSIGQKSIHRTETRMWRVCSTNENEKELDSDEAVWTSCSVSQKYIFSGMINKTYEPCFEGYTGPLCLGCKEGYAAVGASCVVCDDDKKIGYTIAALAALCIIIYTIATIILVYSQPVGKDARRKSILSKFNDFKIIPRRKFSVLLGRPPPPPPLPPPTPRRLDSNLKKNSGETKTLELKRQEHEVGKDDDDEDDIRKVFGQLKIIINFTQILGSMPFVMVGVPFPNSVKSLSRYLQAMNFDAVQIFMHFSCKFALSFREQFIVYFCMPPVIVALIFLAYRTSNHIKPSTVTHRRHRLGETYRLIILFILISFPAMCTKLFSMLNCTYVPGIPGKQYLLSDMNVECWADQHIFDGIVAIIFILLYIVGVPFGMFIGMWRNRDSMYDKKHPRHAHVSQTYGGLYDNYEEKYWFTELVVILHKVLMTGCLVVIAPGSTLQPLVAFCFQMTFLIFILKTMPYKSNVDDLLALISALAICITSLGALMLITADANKSESIDHMEVSAFILVCSVCAISIEISIVIYEVIMKRKRQWCCKKQVRKLMNLCN